MSENTEPTALQPLPTDAHQHLSADDAAASPAETAPPDVLKPNEIVSIEQFLDYAYSKTGKRFSIPPAAVKAMADEEPNRTALMETITRLGHDDPLLAVPPRILSAIDNARVPGKLRKTLLGLVALPILQHPDLAPCELSNVLLGETPPEEQPDPHVVLASIRQTLTAVTEEPEASSSQRRLDRRHLASNAVLAVAMHLAITESWTSQRLAECLDPHLWQPELEATKVRSARALLVDNTTVPTLGLVARAWHGQLRDRDRQLREATAQATDAANAAARANDRAGSLESERADLEAGLAHREAEMSRLEHQLKMEQEQRRIDRSHAVDDYETLRTQQVRNLARQTQLLEDGLHALRSGSGGVAEEYMERVIEALRAELDSLRNRTPEESEG